MKSLIIGVLGTIIIFFLIGASSYYDIDDIMSKLKSVESDVSNIEYTVSNIESYVSSIESDVSYIKRWGVDCN